MTTRSACIHTALLTPCHGVRLEGPHLDQGNRIVRQYRGQEANFLRVRIVEEDGADLYIPQDNSCLDAEQMLQLQNEKEDEIQALKSTIRDKQQKILVVEEKAVEADRSWQEVLDARDHEIAAFQTTTREASETNTMLQNENASLKKRFQEYIRHSKGIIERFQAAVLTAKTVVDDEGDLLKAEGDSMLEELELMDEVPAITVATTQRSTKKKTRGRSKRQQDSGIGMDEEEIGEDSLMAEV